MAISHTIYDTATLLGVLRDRRAMAPPENYWLPLCFPTIINFTDEYIDFTRISENRKLAPLVVPTAQGVPIYSAAERLTRVKPAYLKPKDPVTATRMLKRAAGLGEIESSTPLTPQQRYDAIIADIQRQHRWSIERRWEWMAAQAIIYGSVTLEDERYPRTVIDFLRAADHSVTLGVGARWGDSGVSIMGDIQTWRDRIRIAPFGGPTNRITVGTSVWAVMREDQEIKDLLKMDYRAFSNGVSINLGLREGVEAERVGTLGGNLELWVYSDYYQDSDGTVVPLMDPRDIVLTGTNIQGARCFGAIQDVGASFQALPIFPKMWNEQDPSVTFVMNQSAPLMVPVNPNNSLRARVLA